jgi:hypothetical protein
LVVKWCFVVLCIGWMGLTTLRHVLYDEGFFLGHWDAASIPFSFLVGLALLLGHTFMMAIMSVIVLDAGD